MRDKIPEINTARALGIFLVVVAHVLIDSSGTPQNALASWIYLFHMPLFFAVSGFVFQPSTRATMLRKRISTLAIPYVAGLATILVLDTVISYLRGVDPSVHTAKGMIGILIGGSFANGIYGVLWFVTCLFIVNLVYNEIAMRWRALSIPTLAIMTASIVISVALSFMPSAPNPLGVLCVPVALVAFWFGGVLRSFGVLSKFSTAVILFGAVAIAAVVAVGLPLEFDMKHIVFGVPVIGVAIALACTTIFSARVSPSGKGRLRKRASISAL